MVVEAVEAAKGEVVHRHQRLAVGGMHYATAGNRYVAALAAVPDIDAAVAAIAVETAVVVAIVVGIAAAVAGTAAGRPVAVGCIVVGAAAPCFELSGPMFASLGAIHGRTVELLGPLTELQPVLPFEFRF